MAIRRTTRSYLLILFALLAFMGQLSAAPRVACQFPSHDTRTAMDMHHAMVGMKHVMHLRDQQMSADCCQGGEHCLMSGCVSVFTVESLTLTSQPAPLEIDSTVSVVKPRSPLSSLYRPPIAA